METLSTVEGSGKDRIREEVTNAFQDRGITIGHLTDAVIEEWALDPKNHHIRAQIKDSIQQKVFTNEQLHSSVLWGLAFDKLAQEGKLQNPIVSELVNGDDSLCNVDEIVAKVSLQELGSGAIDRFASIDRTKANSLPKTLDTKKNPTTEAPQTNMMADDLVITVMVLTEKELFDKGILTEGQLSKTQQSSLNQSRKKHRPDPNKLLIPQLNKSLRKGLNEVGITQELISSKAYELQAPFNAGLTQKFVERQVKDMLKSQSPQQRERAYNLLFALEAYHHIKNPQALPEPLRGHVESQNLKILDPFKGLMSATSQLVSDIGRGQLGDFRSRSDNNRRLEEIAFDEIVNTLSGNAAATVASNRREKDTKRARRKRDLGILAARKTLDIAKEVTGRTIGRNTLANKSKYHDRTMGAQ